MKLLLVFFFIVISFPKIGLFGKTTHDSSTLLDFSLNTYLALTFSGEINT